MPATTGPYSKYTRLIEKEDQTAPLLPGPEAGAESGDLLQWHCKYNPGQKFVCTYGDREPTDAEMRLRDGGIPEQAGTAQPEIDQGAESTEDEQYEGESTEGDFLPELPIEDGEEPEAGLPEPAEPTEPEEPVEPLDQVETAGSSITELERKRRCQYKQRQWQDGATKYETESLVCPGVTEEGRDELEQGTDEGEGEDVVGKLPAELPDIDRPDQIDIEYPEATDIDVVGELDPALEEGDEDEEDEYDQDEDDAGLEQILESMVPPRYEETLDDIALESETDGEADGEQS